MRPLKIIKLQQETDIDLLAAAILDELSKRTTPIGKKYIINPFEAQNISSPATTHKYFSHLKKLGYIQEEISYKDKRFTLVQITETGKQYLRKWGVK